jgi:hypothetical protein
MHALYMHQQVKTHIAVFAMGGECVLNPRDELVSQLHKSPSRAEQKGHDGIVLHGIEVLLEYSP